MSNLTNTKIKDTYGGVLNIGPAGASGSNLVQVTDGFGNPIPMEVSSTTIAFTGMITGIVGNTGPAGSSGSSGSSGTSGTSGTSGSSGSSGSSGTSGSSGSSGSSGTSGTSGIDTAFVTTVDVVNNYTIQSTDIGNLVRLTSPDSKIIEIPNNTDVPIPTGGQLLFTRGGTGEVTIAGATGVTISSSQNLYKLKYQNSGASAVKTGTNNWLLFGELRA